MQGWEEKTGETAELFGKRLVGMGAKRFLFTDIARDGMLEGPNIEATRAFARAVGVPVIASGGVSGIEDIKNLVKAQPDGIEGVITGKALYAGRLTPGRGVRGSKDRALGEIIAIVAILGGVGIPLMAIWASHREKMARILAEQGTKLPPNVVAELQALRGEVATLRETTTRFDMSFDAALTRLEERVDHVEVQNVVATPRDITMPSQETPNVQMVGQGR